MEKINAHRENNPDYAIKSGDELAWECAIKINEIIDWINNYEGAKEKFRQGLLSGNFAGLKPISQVEDEEK